MIRLVCPNGCGHYMETVDPNAVGFHKCDKANGKQVGLVRREAKQRKVKGGSA